jgi:hypothetical protein
MVIRESHAQKIAAALREQVSSVTGHIRLLSAARDYVAQMLGEDVARALVEVNPGIVVESGDVASHC